MYCIENLTEDYFWVGGSDRRLALFENVYPVSGGVSYNSYLLMDEKTVLMDTADRSILKVFLENISSVLGERKLDYVVINHAEPDHAATLQELVLHYPECKIICNEKSAAMLRQFFCFDLDCRMVLVTEGESMSFGRHTVTFLMAPMVHWPEVMMTYDRTEKILFSADAFGSFGAINGNLFADECDLLGSRAEDLRRYYTNIVGKYGPQVHAVLKKAAELEIKMICPLHGPVFRRNIAAVLEKYQRWSTYTPEEDAVMIAYASVYGNTENAVNILAQKLAERGVKNIKMYDVSVTHPSYIVAEAFRCSHLVFASTTYNAEIFVNMDHVLRDIVSHKLENRTVALIENGSWAPASGPQMKQLLSGCGKMRFLEPMVTVRSSLREEQLSALDAMADAICDSMPKPQPIIHDGSSIEAGAFFKLSYGLFLLSASEGEKENACIVNTVIQLTDQPKRISVAVNKANLTHDMLLKSGHFTASILTQETPFALYQRFGFQSGRDADKFAGFEEKARTKNGNFYYTGANAYLSGRVVSTLDFETHTVFIAEVTEAYHLSQAPSVTYEYYFANVKPKPQPTSAAAAAAPKKGWVCKICGYVYEGEVLPLDFVCPICKHGADDFEPLK